MGRYCRGVDRADAEMLASAYWSDAFDNHVAWQGKASDLVPWLVGAMQGFNVSFHMIGQSNIAFRSPTDAEVETYFINYLSPRGDASESSDILQCGRYLDVFTCRDREWRVAHRNVVTDGMREIGPAPDPTKPLSGAVWPRGSLGAADPSYRIGS